MKNRKLDLTFVISSSIGWWTGSLIAVAILESTFDPFVPLTATLAFIYCYFMVGDR